MRRDRDPQGSGFGLAALLGPSRSAAGRPSKPVSMVSDADAGALFHRCAASGWRAEERHLRAQPMVVRVGRDLMRILSCE